MRQKNDKTWRGGIRVVFLQQHQYGIASSSSYYIDWLEFCLLRRTRLVGWLADHLLLACCACIGMKWWIDSNDGVYKLKVLLLQQPCPDLLSSVEELLLTNISVSEWQLQDASVWRSSINHACSREDDERTNDSHHHDGFAPSSPLCSSHSSSSRP